VTLYVDAPLNADELWTLKERVYQGMLNRIVGDDSKAHMEHWLQATISDDPSILPVQPSGAPRREFPAVRPGGGNAYIDFLYIDSDATLHIVETKIGTNDEMFVIQGLDYWLWAHANRDLLSRYFGVETSEGIVIDYVVGEKDGRIPDTTTSVISSYAPAQLSCLSPDVTWGIHRIAGWQTETPTLTSLGQRTLPTPPHIHGHSMNVPHWE
jgi:hypothetical protein